MIINEKYLQDIDDEDDDVAVSDEIANNRFDFEVTLNDDFSIAHDSESNTDRISIQLQGA